MKQYRIWMLPYIKLCVLVAVATIMAVASVMKGDAPNKKALTDVPTAPMEILPAYMNWQRLSIWRLEIKVQKANRPLRKSY